MHQVVFNPSYSQTTYIIAEAGVNHNGDLRLAHELIDGAVQAGADAVKFQLFDPDSLTAGDAPMAEYQKRSGESTSQRDMLARLALNLEDFARLQAYCREKGILFLCSPFDEKSARQLVEQLNLPLLKIPSGEITNVPYLSTLSGLQVPLVLSTGMSTLSEVETAVKTIRENGSPDLALLHCVSAYPTPVEAVNLRAMQAMKEAFPECAIGFSDHTEGLHIAVAAVAQGARIIEKHFTTDRNLPGPDHQASLTVLELTEMIRQIRDVEAALGHGRKEPHPIEADVARVARKSLVIGRDLPAGHQLTLEDIAIKRPGTGLPPARLPQLIGRTLQQPVCRDQLLTEAVLGL